MDEIFTWKEVSDASLWHLYRAIERGADGGMPFFYTTAWLWAKAFGNGVLTLRLYSCVAMCGALLITWKTIRRFYGMRSTAFGVLTLWGTSALLLDQNVEARFYGLYMLMVAIAIAIYTRLVEQPQPGFRLLMLALLSQAALALTHVIGVIYGALILLALILLDAAKGRFRGKVYLFCSAGWLSLLVWVPALQTSMAAGKPHGWIQMPTIKSLLLGYLFQDCEQWLAPLSHTHEVLFQIILRAVELMISFALASVFLIALRRLVTQGRETSNDPRSAFLLVAYLLLSVPLILFVLSHLITPVFVPRYFLPSGIGLAIVLAAFADALGADSAKPSRLVWTAVICVLAISPVLSVLALPPLERSTFYLDVQRLDATVPPNSVVVASWIQDFAKIMRYSRKPHAHYYFLLDWPSALAGFPGFVVDYHLMQAYQQNGYYPQNIEESHRFLCSHPDFLVLNTEDYSWFNLTIKKMPQFEWKVVHSFDIPGLNRNLIAVHRTAPLAFCSLVLTRAAR